MRNDFSVGDPELRRLLWFLLGGTRGGENRARIIYELSRRPSNMNQLAKSLGVHYRSIDHHIGVLLKNSLIVSSGGGYGTAYSIHPWLEHNFVLFEGIVQQLQFPKITKDVPKVQPLVTARVFALRS